VLILLRGKDGVVRTEFQIWGRSGKKKKANDAHNVISLGFFENLHGSYLFQTSVKVKGSLQPTHPPKNPQVQRDSLLHSCGDVRSSRKLGDSKVVLPRILHSES
jgi:hypothetical protein